MNRKQNIIPLKELNLTNRFLFDEVMEDAQTHREVLEYIIIIMTFDLFGHGKYRYTFEPKCREVPDLILPDGATRIFLNTKGENDGEVSPELAEFLHYVEETTDFAAERAESDRIRRIHERVRRVRASEEVGMRYLRELEEKYFEYEEGREEGKNQGIALARQIFNLDKQGKSPEEIARLCRLTVEKVKEILS